ncbi:MAG: DUF6930 domain-containing protein [Bacteroidota bacterium]
MTKKASSPTLEQWKRLYELMDEIKGLAPWQYMYEHNMFGIRFPETGELGFVSVMGNLGEHLAVAVYIGKRGFEGFWTMQRLGYDLTPDVVLQIPQVQASLEDREFITSEDRKVIKQLNLKFRGKNAWPQFRSYRPGCFPWYLEEEEAQILAVGLEQLLDVAPRFQNNPDLLAPQDSRGIHLVRVFEDGKWTEQHQEIKFPPDPPLQLKMDPEALEHLKTLSRRNSIVEIDLQMMDQAVQEDKSERPYFPFLLMIADKQSQMILGADLLSPLPSLESMWESLPAVFTAILAGHPLPKEVQTKDSLISLLLSPLEKELGIRVRLVSRLPTIDHAKREFNRFMDRSSNS